MLEPKLESKRVLVVDDYLGKPIRKEDLGAKLAQWEKNIFERNETLAESSHSPATSLPQSVPTDVPHVEIEIEALKIAIASINYHEIIQEAHFLKGSSASAANFNYRNSI